MKTGIISYGAYLPSQAITAKEIAQAHGLDQAPDLGVAQKSVPGQDEDTATMAVEAIWQALSRLPQSQARLAVQQLGALFIGSESHPYAVKPTGTMVQSALGLSKNLAMADLQFACKAGTQSLQIAQMYLQAGQTNYALAVGADTAQASPGDALEYTAAAGAAAFLLGTDPIVTLLDTFSYATDTPDFWRRNGQDYPRHAGRFTGEPAYFDHIYQATNQILQKNNLTIADFDYVIFHTPNGKFPKAMAKKMQVQSEQMRHSLIVKQVGNTYAAAAMLTLANVLDHALPGQRILMTSYGSGSGADSFIWQVEPGLARYRQQWSSDSLANKTVQDFIEKLQLITYQQYQMLSPGGHQ